MEYFDLEVIDTDDQSEVTIHFDDDVNVEMNKSLLIENSAYFQAMFSGRYIESQIGHRIHIKDISHIGFMKVINSLKNNQVIFNDLEDLLLILEVSQILQFSFIIFQSTKIIEEKYLFTINAVNIFPKASKLRLKNLLDKAHAYILYNFTTILRKNKVGFLKLNEHDLHLLLKNINLNVENEKEVFDLIVDWCSMNDNYNFEYELAINCVYFKRMTQEQLKYCISKTKNIHLQNAIKVFINFTKNIQNTVSLTKPIRCIPHVLCAVKNEDDGHAFMYRWDWDIRQFVKFLRLDPLPLNTTGFQVIIKDLDIYVLSGKKCIIEYGKKMWNEDMWKYNLLTEQWKILRDCKPFPRHYGLGYFCGDNLVLLGGVAKNRLANEVIEYYVKESDSLNYVTHKPLPSNDLIQMGVHQKLFITLEYKGNLVLIAKSQEPLCFYLTIDPSNKNVQNWSRRRIPLPEVVICGSTYNDIVYILAYNRKRIISLHSYCPINEFCQKLKSFTIKYDEHTTMCAFNIDKVMVFKDDTLQYYSIGDIIIIEYKIQLNSFHSDYLLSVPMYLKSTY
ncbi:hypothetical protein AGLY_015427 [Aphis glycines]|uniref:BTB domain-containing protein n=1 Tax=Aphis glycines TaxID=307491 RepID=A0A6G0T100_APHGL|nr:hypothetical protein AGLY_015427 [Aphis glycines]